MISLVLKNGCESLGRGRFAMGVIYHGGLGGRLLSQSDVYDVRGGDCRDWGLEICEWYDVVVLDGDDDLGSNG